MYSVSKTMLKPINIPSLTNHDNEKKQKLAKLEVPQESLEIMSLNCESSKEKLGVVEEITITRSFLNMSNDKQGRHLFNIGRMHYSKYTELGLDQNELDIAILFFEEAKKLGNPEASKSLNNLKKSSTIDNGYQEQFKHQNGPDGRERNILKTSAYMQKVEHSVMHVPIKDSLHENDERLARYNKEIDKVRFNHRIQNKAQAMPSFNEVKGNLDDEKQVRFQDECRSTSDSRSGFEVKAKK